MADPFAPQLGDYLSLLSFHIEQAHKFWAYFHAVGLAAMAFVWSGTDEERPRKLIGITAAFFVMFAAVNGWLLNGSQEAALKAYDALVLKLPAYDCAAGDAGDATRRFACAVKADKPMTPATVAGLQIALAAFTIALLAARCWLRRKFTPSSAGQSGPSST